MNQVRIRDMDLGDVAEVYSLGSQESKFCVVEEEEGFWRRDILENWVNSYDDVSIIAESGGDLVGFFLATYHPVTRKGTLENAFVKPGYRERGIAARMYEEVEKRLIEKNAAYICGFVETKNQTSLGLIEKFGFLRDKEYHWMIKFL
jgi:ribosomal protein S18 acetylase RimI-like enzyme|tara:strand:- start:2199 stop:2639 length:441 start_codon:yes stop_codon:yes gene_type:complete